MVLIGAVGGKLYTYTHANIYMYLLNLFCLITLLPTNTFNVLSLLLAGQGWQTSDVTKSVVIPFKMTFLVTNYIDDTHVQGKSVMSLMETLLAFSKGQWYIFNAGLNLAVSTYHSQPVKYMHPIFTLMSL